MNSFRIEKGLNLYNPQENTSMQHSQQSLEYRLPEMERKLIEMEQKLRVITQSYVKLKQLIREKDEQIRQLKIENHRITKMQQHKENSYLAEIRKKYEIQGHRRHNMESIDSKNYNVDPVIRLAKSLSPSVKLKSQPIEISKIGNSRVQTGDHEADFDEFYQRRVVKQEQPIIASSSPRDSTNQFGLSIFDQLNKESIKKQRLSQQKGRSADTQGVILQELWQERDRQIRRMDELFENLNKRINKQA